MTLAARCTPSATVTCLRLNAVRNLAWRLCAGLPVPAPRLAMDQSGHGDNLAWLHLSNGSLPEDEPISTLKRWAGGWPVRAALRIPPKAKEPGI